MDVAALHSAMFTSTTRAYQLWGRNIRRCAQAVARPNLKVIFDDSASNFNQSTPTWKMIDDWLKYV